jgi:hypothetical protein
MALRNAFDNLSIEDTQQSVLSILNNIEILLSDIAQNQGFRDQANGAQRVITNGGTVATVSNVAALGNVSANMDQYSQFANTAGVLRQSIVVS